MLHHNNRIPVRIDCPCHDPTVFGHLTCTRAETQPNNTPRHPSEPTHTITISTSTLSGAAMTCALHDEAQRVRELGAAARETARQIADITATLNYITRRYSEPPPHG